MFQLKNPVILRHDYKFPFSVSLNNVPESVPAGSTKLLINNNN